MITRNGENTMKIQGKWKSAIVIASALFVASVMQASEGLKAVAMAASGASRVVTSVNVVITITPVGSTSVWGFEEILPPGITPLNITGANGNWNVATRKITWYSTGASMATLGYSVTGAAGTYGLTGTANFDGIDQSVSGNNQVVIGGATETVSAPTTPSGASSGQVAQSLSYNVSGGASSMGHSLQFQFDWGDGIQSSWGAASQSKSWSSAGSYSVKARARCAADTAIVSIWSSVKSVTITNGSVMLGSAWRFVTGTNVIITITPAIGTSAWGFEEVLPLGITPSNITGANGNWNVATRKITWYLTGSAIATLGYSVSGALGTYPITGNANFDGVDQSVAGGSQVTIAPGAGATPTIVNPGSQSLIVGVAFSLGVEVQSASLPTVSVSGLPTGLKYNAATKVIAGVPTAAVMNKPVTIAVRNKAGQVATLTFSMTVDPLPTWAWGTFNGWFRVGHDYVGVASLTVSKLGKISGKCSTGGTNYTFNATSYTNGSSFETGFRVMGNAKGGGSTTVPVALVVNSLMAAGGPAFLSKVEGRVNGVVGGEAPLVLYRNVWNDLDMKAATNLDGYYTATLPSDGSCGSGYLAFTLKKGSVKSAGKLADGNAVSLSSTLLVDESNRSFFVLYTTPTSYKGGCFFGMPEFLGPEAGGPVIVRPLEGEAFVWNNFNPLATGTYGEGFGRDVGLVGGWYDKLGNLYAYYMDRTLSVGTSGDAPAIIVGASRHESVWWNPNGQPLYPVTNALGVLTGITAQRVGPPVNVGGSWDYDLSANTVGLTFSMTRSTGVFKGAFKAWFDYGTTHTSKNIAFEGVLTPEREDGNDGIEGRGFYMWEDKGQYMNSLNRIQLYPFKWSCDFLLFSER